MNVCLLSIGPAIGDFITTLPALAALRAKHARDHITIVALKAHLPLVKPDLCDLLLPYRERGPDFYAGFDRVISFALSPDNADSVQADGPNVTVPRSAFLMRLHGLDGPHFPELRWQAKGTGSMLAVHMALDRSPRWGAEQWMAVFGAALDSNIEVLLIAGAEEQFDVKRMVAKLPKERIKTVFAQPLDKVAQALAECRTFVCHDSGIGHIAAAVGLPGHVVHFRDLNHGLRWKPPRQSVRLIDGWKSVDGAITEILTLHAAGG